MRVSALFSQIIVALRSHVLLAEGTPLAYVRSVVTNFSFSLHYLMHWKDVYFRPIRRRNSWFSLNLSEMGAFRSHSLNIDMEFKNVDQPFFMCLCFALQH